MTGTSRSTRLGPNEVYVVLTRDGSATLYSRAYHSMYHSLFGAVSESRHVFLQEGLLTQLHKKEIRILELGFGTGLNAFLAYLFAVRHHIHITYQGIETFPIGIEIARQLDYPGYLVAADQEGVFFNMHELDEFENPLFSFHLTPNWEWVDHETQFDCIFFDAFDPASQPDLWTQDIFDIMYSITSEGGCLITYCAQGEVRRRMQKAGYMVERIAGAPGKREMLRALKK